MKPAVNKGTDIITHFSGKFFMLIMSRLIKRARSQIGRAGYNLAFNNCEHFAVWCKTGRSDSSQTEILDVASIPEKILSFVEDVFSL